MGGYFSNSRLFQGLQLPPRPNFGSDTNGITGQGPMLDTPNPSDSLLDLPDLPQMPSQNSPGAALQLPPIPQGQPSNPSLPSPAMDTIPQGSGVALPPPPAVSPPQVALPPAPTAPAIPQQNPAISRAISAPANVPPGAPTPSTKRQILGGLAATFKPTEAFAPLITYGRKGLEQEHQRAEAIQMLPHEQAAGNLASVESDRQERGQMRQEGLDERKSLHSQEAYKAKVQNITARFGEAHSPNDPVPPGYTVESVVNPTTQRVETYRVPSRAVHQQEIEKAKQENNITVTPELSRQVDGAVQAGEKYPKEVFNELLRVAAAKAKDPNLQIEKLEDDSGNVTLTAVNKATGVVVKSTVLPKAGKSKTQPQGPQTMIFAPGQNGEMTAQTVKPGQTVPQGAVTAAGMNTLSTGTAQMRGRGEMSKTVLEQTPKLLTSIDALKSKIGPAKGRWEKLWVNKAGMDDPEFAALDENLHFLASAIAVAHFGMRGSQAYRDALEKRFGTAQSPEDLKARIQSADSWLEGYAHAAGSSPKAGAPAPGTEGAGGIPTIGGSFNGEKVLKVEKIK